MKNLKKCLFTLTFLLTCHGSLWAQPDFDTWGKVYNEDKLLKVCDFDKEADAIVLLDEAVSDFNADYNLVTWRHKRIKILKEKGIEWANISIPFYARDGFQSVDDIAGFAYNFDSDGKQNTVALERKSVFTEPSSEYWHRKKFTFPGLKAGSIIEFKYAVTSKNYQGLDDWYFHDELPVLESKYDLSIPANTEFAYLVHKSDQLPIEIKPDKQNGRIFFEMKNIPGLRDEPYMDARRDYLQRVTFQLAATGASGFGKQKHTTSWEEVSRELMSSPAFGSQIGKNISGTEDFITLMKLLPAPVEKMKRIYNYTRNYMEWNGMYGIYVSDGVKQAWSKKTGTVAEINMVLLNLLLEAGLDAYPLLVSERRHGKISQQYPFLDDFNALYVMVIIGDKNYFLDATDMQTHAEMIPATILNTTAYIVHRKKGGLINITDQSFLYKESITNNIKINKDNSISGSLFISSSDYARSQRVRQYRRNKQKYIDAFRGASSDITVDSFDIKNLDTDTLALREFVMYKGKANGSAEYIFVNVNLFSGFESNPFLAESRFSDINFGFKQNINVSTYIDIPAGYAPEELPKSLQLVNADKTVICVREIFHDTPGNKILARFRIEFRKSLYTADEYGELKEFYKKMVDMLGEPIALKKK